MCELLNKINECNNEACHDIAEWEKELNRCPSKIVVLSKNDLQKMHGKIKMIRILIESHILLGSASGDLPKNSKNRM